MAKPHIIIYADGWAIPGTDGQGGWACMVIQDDDIQELSGSESGTSTSRMKLMAVFMALESLEDASKIELHIDSKYVRSGVTRWMAKWVQTGWRASNNQPVQNKDLWEDLHEMTEAHEIRWDWTQHLFLNLYEKRVEELAIAAREHYTAPAMVALTPHGDPKVDTRIYVEGSYVSGSWAAVLVTESGAIEITGQGVNTTSNQTILLACAKLLEDLTIPQTIAIYSLNEYLINGMTKWVPNWIRNDWHTANGGDVKNQEEWKHLVSAAQPHIITWILSDEITNIYHERANNLVIDFD